MTEDVVRFITAQYGKLTAAEKTAADYLIRNFQAAIHMSVHELAKKAGVSAATPVRLAQRLGFPGYKEFRLYLAQRQPEHEDLVLDIKQTTDSLSKTIEKVMNAETASIRLTLGEVDSAALQEIAERICAARQLLFFGMGTSGLVCSDVVAKFRRVGKVAHCTDDLYEAVTLLSSFSKEDVLVCISNSGETEAACKAMEFGKESGIYCVAMTTFAGSSICRYADRLLYTQTRESPMHKIAITSRISQFALMDVLFMAYLAADYEKCEKHLNLVSDNLKHTGLVP